MNLGKYLVIEKNNNKYRVVFLLGNITKKDIDSIKRVRKDIKGTIIINNTNLDKKIYSYIKENRLYSITKPGLINIIKNKQKDKTEVR